MPNVTVYAYESDASAITRVAIFGAITIVLVILFCVFSGASPSSDSVYEPANYSQADVESQVIYVCIPENRQLQNMGLLVDNYRYFNVPINPTIQEAQLDGIMAQKTIIDGKILYKIELPIEVNLSSITLDLAGGGIVFIFIENMNGRRVWEKYINLGSGRYHTIKMSNLTMLH